MSKHGDFGLAFQIGQGRLNDLLVMAHRVGRLPRWVSPSSVVPDVDGNGLPSMALTGWVDAPQVSLQAAQPDTVEVSIRFVGKFVISGADSVSATPRQVRLTMTFDAGVNVSLREQIVNGPWPLMEQVTYDAVANFSPVLVTDSALVVLDGPPLPAAWLSFFKGPLFRFGAGTAFAQQLSDVETVLPDEFVPIVDLLGVADGTTVSGTARAGDGFLSLLFNVVNPGLGVATAGKIGDVVEFLSGRDVAAVIDAALAPILAEQTRKLINHWLDDAEVTSLAIKLKNDRLRIGGHAEGDFGDGTFKFDAEPRIGTEGYAEVVDDEYGQWDYYVPPSDEIWLDVKNVSVDIDIDWWAYGLGIPGVIALFALTPGGGAALPAVGGAISDAIAAIPVRIVKQGEINLLAAHQKRRLFGPDSVPVGIDVSQLSVFPSLVVSRISLSPDSVAAINGAGAIPIEGIGSSQKYTLTADPLLWDAHDPEARIRWQIRRSDTGETIFTITRSASDPKANKIKINFADLAGGSEPIPSAFSVQVRVFRAAGWGYFDYFNRTLSVSVVDRLDRSHPYVRWHRDIVALSLGMIVIHRRSALHRTAYPGRCKFADQYSYKLDEGLPEYLDELPFPMAEIPTHQKEICEYCFYGGPDKHDLIFDPKPAPKP